VPPRAKELPKVSAGLLELLVGLQDAGVVPVRHGTFVGFKNVRRLTPELRGLADRYEDALRRQLPDSPTPYQQRTRGV